MDTAVSQMSIRLSSRVKKAGDTALSKLGVTPTEFVRAIWEKLAQGGAASDELSGLVMGTSVASAGRLSGRRLALEQMRSHYAQGMASLGIDIEQVPACPEEEAGRDLYADALVDRMVERGTWEQ